MILGVLRLTSCPDVWNAAEVAGCSSSKGKAGENDIDGLVHSLCMSRVDI